VHVGSYTHITCLFKWNSPEFALLGPKNPSIAFP
jgi:hypothetical protein